MQKIPSSEITPERIYLSRRKFMQGIGALTVGSLALGACADLSQPMASNPEAEAEVAEVGVEELASVEEIEQLPQTNATTDELGDPLTSFEAITNYNNFYEFSIHKDLVAEAAKDFQTSPWTVHVSGLVRKPKVYDVEELLTKFDQEERVYRLRCVEGWSMVIPWLGFPLAKLLEEVEPTSQAKFVRFETIYDPEQMPGQRNNWYQWPYVEGLRLDEAMHDLTILSTGLYGKHLLPQNGAPIRLVVPWKYGFKSIKSIVRIQLVDKMPTSLWMAAAPHEYGFYANVNPDVPHPRWSQSTERRIGESGRRPTLFLNGYAEEVGHLYADMDLRQNY